MNEKIKSYQKKEKGFEIDEEAVVDDIDKEADMDDEINKEEIEDKNEMEIE